MGDAEVQSGVDGMGEVLESAEQAAALRYVVRFSKEVLARRSSPAAAAPDAPSDYPVETAAAPAPASELPGSTVPQYAPCRPCSAERW